MPHALAPVRMPLAFTLALAGFLTAPAGAQDGSTPPAIDALRAFLTAEDAEGVLYRFQDDDDGAPRWVTTLARDGSSVERPNPTIPHRTIQHERLVTLAPLAGPGRLEVKDVDFLSHSWALEILSEGEPVARLDFHTKGWGKASIFLVDLRNARLAEGSAQFTFMEDGKKTWLDAIKGIWDEAEQGHGEKK
ncbi:MAG: hypothetical protein HY720_03490 [Planctomycetes bacterium]|nr:hypothetical protein [Planctomycetota bacterium]